MNSPVTTFKCSLPLDAVSVSSIDEVPIVNLYYITSMDKFCLRVKSGNVVDFSGRLPSSEDQYEQKCKWGEHCCINNCKYYHNHPMEVRNFNKWSWIYGTNSKSQCRRIGNADTIYSDIASSTPYEQSKLSEQSMQLLISSLYLSNYQRKI
jgi:hypothetical protein